MNCVMDMSNIHLKIDVKKELHLSCLSTSFTISQSSLLSFTRITCNLTSITMITSITKINPTLGSDGQDEGDVHFCQEEHILYQYLFN